MTFREVSEEYNSQYLAYRTAYEAWYNDPATIAQNKAWTDSRSKTRRKDDVKIEPAKYTGPDIDYQKINAMMIQAAQDEYGFTAEQASFIHHCAYEDYHAHYGDMPGGMSGLCDRFKQWDAMKKNG